MKDLKYIIIIPLLFIILLSSCSKESLKPETLKPEKENARYMAASWYGKQFHGKKTASGDIFDMYALTAAHKKLPFGTKLLVINPDNNKSTTVTINDRGPYIWGRELDLSYKAASEIGIIGPGTKTVKVMFLGTDHSYDNKITEKVILGNADLTANNGPYTVQLGTFADNFNAVRMKTALEERYKDTEIFEDLINGNKYYKVRTGKFNTKSEAHKFAKALIKAGYETIVIRYK